MKKTMKKKLLVSLGALLMATVIISVLATQTYQSPWTPISYKTMDVGAFEIRFDPQWPLGPKPDPNSPSEWIDPPTNYKLYYFCWYTIIINVSCNYNGILAKMVLNFFAKNPAESDVNYDLLSDGLEVMLSENPDNPPQEPKYLDLINKTSSYSYINGNSSAYWWEFPENPDNDEGLILSYILKFRVMPTFPKNKALEIMAAIYEEPTT